MIVRLFLVTATLLMLNPKAFGYNSPSVIVPSSRSLRTATETATAIGQLRAVIAAHSHDLESKAQVAFDEADKRSQQDRYLLELRWQTCFDTGMSPSPSQLDEQIASCSEASRSPLLHPAALPRLRERLDTLVRFRRRFGDPAFQAEQNHADVQSPTDQVQTSFRPRTLKIIDYIRDGLKSVEALVFYSVAFGFGLFVLLSLYDAIAHDRRSIRRIALNLVLSTAAIAGIVTTGFVAPPIWEWILSLDTPAVVLLATVICGTMALFIPLKFWQTLKDRNSLARTSLSEAPKESAPAPKGAKAELNKKAIKEAALRSRTEEFDV
jgi:hypothetical protein